MNEKEKLLLEYLKAMADDITAFCEKNGIEGLAPADITIYTEKDSYLRSYVTVGNENYIYSASCPKGGEWKLDDPVEWKWHECG